MPKKSWNKGMTNPFYGKKHTPETLEKMRLAHEGKERASFSKEWCQHISDSLKGKREGNANPFFGRKHTPQELERMRLSHLGVRRPPSAIVDIPFGKNLKGGKGE